MKKLTRKKKKLFKKLLEELKIKTESKENEEKSIKNVRRINSLTPEIGNKRMTI